MTRTFRWPAGVFALAVAAVLGGGGVARGGLLTDATGDFLPMYTRAKHGAFDVSMLVMCAGLLGALGLAARRRKPARA
jgi:hypothetical protein